MKCLYCDKKCIEKKMPYAIGEQTDMFECFCCPKCKEEYMNEEQINEYLGRVREQHT